MIRIRCRYCGYEGERPESLRGKTVQCKECGSAISVSRDEVAGSNWNFKTFFAVTGFLVLLLFCVGLLSNNGGKKQDPGRTQRSEIPDDVTYKIINEDIVPGIKRSLDIRLNRKVSENTLEAVARKLKSTDSTDYERTFIAYYLPGMKLNAGCWATTHFDPDVEVRVLGLSLEQENALNDHPTDPTQQIVGMWLQEEEPFPGKITIFQQDEAFFMEKIHRDGSKGRHEMVEMPFNKGRKFMKVNRTGSNEDFYVVDESGNLQLWSQDFDGSHVLVVTAMKSETRR